MRAFCFILIFLLFTCSIAFAQLSGGNGDGSATASASTFLDGTSLGQVFSGGIGDGYASNHASTFLSGNTLASIFNGGSGDGYAKNQNSQLLDGSLLPFYQGGTGDGYTANTAESFLDGTLLTHLFGGGIGDGYSQFSSSGFLDGTTLASLFSGGNGDGFANAFGSQFIDGTNLNMFAGGGGDGYSANHAFILPIGLEYAFWIGATSTNWHTGTNWYSGNIPLGDDDVIIDGTPINQPVIGVSVTTVDLEVRTGAQVQVQGGQSLHVTGNLEIADPEGLVLKSTASNTGYSQLLVEGTALGSGTVKGEFYVSGNHGFRQISSPFNTSFTDLNTGTNLLIADNYPQGNIFNWNANTANWDYPNNLTDNFSKGIGYTVFMGTNNYGTYVSPLPAVLDLVGEIHTGGGVIVPLDYHSGQGSNFFPPGTPQAQTEGWNLLGNPFTSTYDWDGQSFSTEMTNTGMAVWNSSIGSYSYYNNGVSTNGGSRYIAPYQGVFVQTTAASTFTFELANRTIDQNPPLLKAIPENIVISISTPDGLMTDEMLIGFTENSTDGFDGAQDMWKLTNDDQTSSVYSVSNNGTYAINFLADFKEHKSIRAGFQNPNPGQYLIKADLTNFNPTYSVELEDLKNQVFQNLRTGPYTFAHDPSNDANRFYIHINKKGEFVSDISGNPEELVFIRGTEKGISIDFSMALSGPKEVRIHTLIGQQLVETTVEEDVSYVEIPVSTQQSTYIIVQVQGTSWILNQKVFIDQ